MKKTTTPKINNREKLINNLTRAISDRIYEDMYCCIDNALDNFLTENGVVLDEKRSDDTKRIALSDELLTSFLEERITDCFDNMLFFNEIYDSAVDVADDLIDYIKERTDAVEFTEYEDCNQQVLLQ